MIDNDVISKFVNTYNVTDLSIDHNYGTLQNAYGPSYHYSTGESTVSMKLAGTSLQHLMQSAQIGEDEIERARTRADHPNVRAAYDAYITLLALSKKYD